MRKTISISVLSLVAVLTYAGGTTESTADTATHQEGVIEFLEGEVTVDDRPAQFGQVVPAGATVRTARDSTCEIVFEDRNIFRVSENSIAIVSIDPTNPQISLQQGSLAAVFERLRYLDRDATFHLDANVAMAGVRGTVFFIRIEDTETSYICTCNGKLVITTADEERTVSHKHHEAYRFTRTGQTVTVAPAEMAYHSDSDMEELAARIGVAIRWRD